MSDVYNNRKNEYTKKWIRKEGDKLKEMGLKKFEVVRFVTALTKAYNRLCSECRKKVFGNPQRPLSDYCDNCRAVLIPIAKKYTGDKNE